MGKLKTIAKKALPYIGGAVALGGLAYGAKKLLGKKGSRGMARRKGGIGKLRTQVQRLAYKIKKKQLQRKLYKEELRI